jgi:hypothetical protein
MASDDSRPKVRMLLTIGVVSVCLLVGVKFVLDSYYLDMTESYEHGMLPKTEQLDQLRTEEHAAIEKGEKGNIPVSVAMQTLAQKGRDNAGDLITPKPSDDIDALKGWSRLKHDVHLPPQVTTTAPPEPMPMPQNMGADAGAGANATKDGGAPAHARDGGAAPRAPQNNVVKDGGK